MRPVTGPPEPKDEGAQENAGESGRPARSITLGAIARELRVSTATVSLALRDSPLVAEATRMRVKGHARAVGYIYNRSAAALRTARSDMIGVAVHDILNPYFAEIFSALEAALGREHKTVFICNHRDNVERQRSFIDTLMQQRVDGLVLCASIDTTAEEINRIVDQGIPVTLICREVDGVRAPMVRSDDVKGGYLATRHLIEQGHETIAMIGGRRQSSTGRDRNKGWRLALEEAGIDPERQMDVPELMTQADGRAIVPRLLAASPRPTAVMGFNDMVALGILSALRRAGVEPGPGMAITGYDDTDGAESRTPALTSIWNAADHIGSSAARMILRQISGEKVGHEAVLLAPELRVRESSPPPGVRIGPKV